MFDLHCRTIEFEGYTIPANAHVIPLLHSVHMSEELWENPEKFRPERFLTEDGQRVVKPANFLPFGSGQRMCLGDKLAEKEYFLFFSSLLHVFDLQLPEGNQLPSLKGVAAITVTPKDFDVIFVPRAKTDTTHFKVDPSTSSSDVLQMTNPVNATEDDAVSRTCKKLHLSTLELREKPRKHG